MVAAILPRLLVFCGSSRVQAHEKEIVCCRCFAVVIILNLFTAFIIDSVTKEIQRGDPVEIEEAQMAAVENQIRRFTQADAVGASPRPGGYWTVTKSSRVDLNSSLGVPRLLN